MHHHFDESRLPELLEQWNRGLISRIDLLHGARDLLTPDNIDRVIGALPVEVRAGFVQMLREVGEEDRRPGGEHQFVAIGSVAVHPSYEAELLERYETTILPAIRQWVARNAGCR